MIAHSALPTGSPCTPFPIRAKSSPYRAMSRADKKRCVPEFDENYERDSVYEHMVVQTTGWMAGKSHLSFPVAGVRPLAPVSKPCLKNCCNFLLLSFLFILALIVWLRPVRWAGDTGLALRLVRQR